MPEDIVPELLRKIQESFRKACTEDEKLAELKAKLDSGSASYHEANEYASLVGGHMKDAYMEYMKSDNLPDERCYYNIANRIIGTTEGEQYDMVSQYVMQVQETLNKNAGIGLKAQDPGEDLTRVNGLVNVASNADQYDRVAKTVAQGVESMSREVVDRSVEKNAEFQTRSGLNPKIVRNTDGNCCEWCSKLAGTYDYKQAPKDVYARHNNCTCTVEYDPGSGKRQDVWSKRWMSEAELAKREELKTLGLDNHSENDKIEVRKRIGFPETIKLSDEQIFRSVGGMAKNYDIMDLQTGEIYHLVEGTRIQDKEVFAGKGVRTPYRNASKYVKRYGGTEADWMHVKGKGMIDTPEGNRYVEIHWSECENVGKVEMFIKEWLDEG